MFVPPFLNIILVYFIVQKLGGTSAGSGLTGGVSSGDANLSIADQGVTTPRIADGAVTGSKLSIPLNITGNTLPQALVNIMHTTTGTGADIRSAGGIALFAQSGALEGVIGRTLDAGHGGVVAENGGNGNNAYLAGPAAGVYGQSTSGFGVQGNSINNPGVRGTSTNSDGVGGSTATGGKSGVYGFTTHSGGYGVSGANNSLGTRGDLGGVHGVYGVSVSGHGLWGVSSTNDGVKGQSTDGYGVNGFSANTNGVYGMTNATTGMSAGVRGESNNRYGVFGLSTNNDGVRGQSSGSNSSGVFGVTPNSSGYAIYGTNDGNGHRGYLGGQYGAWGKNGDYEGMLGYSDGGVFGRHIPTNNYGYLGMATRAGYFSGNVDINGNLSKSTGSFKIDHPLDAATKYLYHSFVESPDMMNVYNGVIMIDANGEAVVSLPKYFEALNKEFRYQLTCIGGYAPVYIAQEVTNNSFHIAGGKAGIKVSWQVTGIRNDVYAKAHPIIPEVDKSSEERGLYLHPVEHGVSPTLGIDQRQLEKILLHNPARHYSDDASAQTKNSRTK